MWIEQKDLGFNIPKSELTKLKIVFVSMYRFSLQQCTCYKMTSSVSCTSEYWTIKNIFFRGWGKKTIEKDSIIIVDRQTKN